MNFVCVFKSFEFDYSVPGHGFPWTGYGLSQFLKFCNSAITMKFETVYHTYSEPIFRLFLIFNKMHQVTDSLT